VSHFTIELPEPCESARVEIVQANHGMRELAKIGALLCCVKGITENGEHAEKCLKFGLDTLAEMESEIGKNLPAVTLPGGVSLAHALACVQIVKAQREGRCKN
jgi:hypothetical protein